MLLTHGSGNVLFLFSLKIFLVDPAVLEPSKPLISFLSPPSQVFVHFWFINYYLCGLLTL